jgi:hypothetical protein
MGCAYTRLCTSFRAREWYARDIYKVKAKTVGILCYHGGGSETVMSCENDSEGEMRQVDAQRR